MVLKQDNDDKKQSVVLSLTTSGMTRHCKYHCQFNKWEQDNDNDDKKASAVLSLTTSCMTRYCSNHSQSNMLNKGRRKNKSKFLKPTI